MILHPCLSIIVIVIMNNHFSRVVGGIYLSFIRVILILSFVIDVLDDDFTY